MSQLNVQKVATPEDRSLPIFGEFERLADRIRIEAFKLFSRRGNGDGRALDDWLEAERSLCGPAAELIERDGSFVLEVALAGFQPGEIVLTATPREILIKASHERTKKSDDQDAPSSRWSEFRRDEVYRRVELPATVDVAKIKASLKNGLLAVVAPKASESASAPQTIPIAQAS